MLAQQWKLLSPDPGIPGGDIWGVCLLGKSAEERTESLGRWGKEGGTPRSARRDDPGEVGGRTAAGCKPGPHDRGQVEV